MPKKLDSSKLSAYAAMGYDRHDYEACWHHDDTWDLYGLHCHDFYELYIHFRGAKFYAVDDHVFPVEPYSLVVVPPFHMHGLICDYPPEDYERCFLYISPAQLKLCAAGMIDLEQFFTTHVQGGRYQFRLSQEEGETCKRLMKELKESQWDHSAVVRFGNQAKIMQYLSILCKALHREQDVVQPIVVNEAMQEILAYVNEHFTTSIKLEQLARNFGVSTSFLSHEFVKYTGRSVYDYVLYRRVLMAKEMINSAMSLNEVAFQCGFNDYSSFLRAFTKMAGMSPSAYRKMALANK